MPSSLFLNPRLGSAARVSARARAGEERAPGAHSRLTPSRADETASVVRGDSDRFAPSSSPCLTLRENTERPITISEGTNTLVGSNRELLLRNLDEILVSGGKRGRAPEFWDGHAAERIAAHLAGWLEAREAAG